jgi:hypothetical protein
MLDEEDPFDALFESDVARDVRDVFVESIVGGDGVRGATEACVARFRNLLAEPVDGPVVILTIAAMQLRHRSLDETFREASLELLADPASFRALPGERSTRRADRDAARQAMIEAIRGSSSLDLP